MAGARRMPWDLNFDDLDKDPELRNAIYELILRDRGPEPPGSRDEELFQFDSDERTRLHNAVQTNNEGDVENILASKSVNVDEKGAFGLTAVHIAARKGYGGILKRLLQEKPEIDVEDKNRDSPLHLAAKAKCSDTVKILLNGRASVTSTNVAGETPLHSVFGLRTWGSNDDDNVTAIVTALLENGADIGAKTASGQTPLHMATLIGSLEGVKTLLVGIMEAGKSRWLDLFLKQYNTLHIPHIPSISTLLGFNNPSKSNSPGPTTANVNSENTMGYTPFSFAVRLQRTEIVRLMLDEAHPTADLSLIVPLEPWSDYSITTLEHAIRKGNADIVKLFLQPNCSTRMEIDTPWNSDIHYTPLTWAVNEGNVELTEILLQNGARTDIEDKYQNNPLRLSSSLGRIEIINLLLKEGPSIDLKQKENGWTALHYASYRGHYEVVRLLLKERADACIRTTRGLEKVDDNEETQKAPIRGGDTPLSLAVYMLHAESVNVLLGCLKSLTDDSALREKGRYLGVENDGDREVRYSPDRMKWAALHKDTHDLVKFVLQQEDFLDLRDKLDVSPDQMLVEAYSGDFDKLLFLMRRLFIVGNRKTSWTALEWAVYWGKLELVERILVSDNSLDMAREDAKGIVEGIYRSIALIKDASILLKSESRGNAHITHYVLPRLDDRVVGKCLEKLREMEEDYIDIRDALQHNIPVNPGIVKIVDVERTLAPPRLDQSIRWSIWDFFAGIIDIYDAEDGVALLRRSRRVEDVIYEKGPRYIMKSARARINKSPARSWKRSTGLEEENLRLRWVHLPANNMRWMEDLGVRLRLDKRPGSEEQKRPDTDVISQDFLQQSWHQLPMGMKPTCLKLCIQPDTGNKVRPGVKREEESNSNPSEKGASQIRPIPETKWQNSAPEALALYMPYFTFSTLTNEEYGPGHAIHRQTGEAASTAERASLPGPQRIDHDKSSTVRPRNGAARTKRGEPQNGAPPLSETGHALSTIPQVKSYQRLIEAYKDRGDIVHPSRTLDEYFYHSPPDKAAQEDLRYRNRTQVTSKRIINSGAHGSDRGDWAIIRVDQLWLWIIDRKTVISCSTHRMDQIQDPILEGMWKHMNSDEVRTGRRPLPSSAYEMAQFITGFCIDFFHSAKCKIIDVKTTNEVRPVKESIPEIFKNQINKISRDETRLLDDFTSNIGRIISNLESPGSQETPDLLEAQSRQQVKSNFDSIKKASELLKQIKDIRDELNILKSILTQQKGVWNELQDLQSEKDSLRGPAFAIHSIDDMDAHAARVQTAVLSILDLEQNKASIQEAMTSREQAEESVQQGKESIRQGRTLMAFTVVTLFFLPGSFLVALFALNIAAFPHSGGDVYWPNWVLGITFGLTIALLAIILTIVFHPDNVTRFSRKSNHIFKEFIKHLKEKAKRRVARTDTSESV